MSKIVNVLAVLLTCAVLALAADVFRRFGLALYAEQYLAGFLALAMPLLFLFCIVLVVRTFSLDPVRGSVWAHGRRR